MGTKNKIILTALTYGLAILGTISPATAQTCQEMQGEKSEISVRSSTRRYIGTGENKIVSELKHENLIRLDERAKMICLGRAFCFDESSIQNEIDAIDSFVSLVNVQTTAVVNCLQ